MQPIITQVLTQSSQIPIPQILLMLMLVQLMKLLDIDHSSDLRAPNRSKKRQQQKEHQPNQQQVLNRDISQGKNKEKPQLEKGGK